MSRLQHILAAILLLLLSTSFALPSKKALTTHHDSLKPPLRVIPLGASITAGYQPPLPPSQQSGYRLPLHNALIEDGYNISFLGTQSNGAFPQNHHEGYPGLEIDEVHIKALPNIARLQPNLVLVLLGTNDCLHARGRGDISYAVAAKQRMSSLIEDIFAAVPDVMLVLASLPPTRNKDDAEYLLAANRGYEDLVREMRGKGKKIAGVDMWNVAWGDDEWSDGIHFNGKGYDRMARVWEQLLKGAVGGELELGG